MAGGIVQVGMNAVKPIAIIPLIYRLGGLDMTLIKSHIDGRVEVEGPGTSPCPKLHFIMGICAPWVEEDGRTCFHIDSDVSFPQIAVYQCWRNLTSIRLQSPQKPWYNPVDELLARSVIFHPLTICFIVVPDNVLQLMGKRFRPTLLPDHRTFHFATHSGDGESKQSSGGLSSSMEICYPTHEMFWIGSCRKVHVVEVSEKEIYLCLAIGILSPPSWLRHQSLDYSVDGRCRMEFTLDKRSGALPCRALQGADQGSTNVDWHKGSVCLPLENIFSEFHPQE